MYKKYGGFGKFWSSSYGYSKSQKPLDLRFFNFFPLQSFGYIQLLKNKADHNHPASKSSPFN
jgi:hypothetical protein